jgi:hypothetical protein
MKCTAILALATGAYAIQDTSPPVVSLTLPSNANYDDLDCANESCAKSTNAKVAGSRSVTCETGASDAATACPEPTCAAYDHHDGTLTCITNRVLVNNDGSPVSTYSGANAIDRNLRSEWLLTFTAADNAGNAADAVSFTMIFRDTQRPVISTRDFGKTSEGHCDKTDTKSVDSSSTLSYTEACSEGTAAPCTHDLGVGATSKDGYDDDVSANIFVSLAYGGADVQARVKQSSLTKLDLDSRKLGAWTLEYDSADDAGIFGCQETDNTATYTVSINVSDNIAPVIDITGTWDHTATLECGKDNYAEPGANCKDLRDQWDTATSKYLVNNLLNQPANHITPGTLVGSCGRFDVPTNAPALTCGFDSSKATTSFNVVYNCKDSSDNAAPTVTRTITIEDTTPPVIVLKGDQTIENSAGAEADHAGHNSMYEHATNAAGKGLNLDAIGMTCAAGASGACTGGATCTDLCDSNPKMSAELFYGGDCSGTSLGAVTNFPEYTSGDYSIKYVCTDGHSGTARTPLTSSICRKIQNVDHTLPIIQILGSDVMTLEATHDGNYVDDGATCSDQVDGVISQNVEVSGDVVNLSKVGAYEITYNCKDSAGNAAPTMKRTVHVAQTSCPTCSLVGNNPQSHEASFAYSDAGVTCSDLIDGTVSGTTMKPVGPEGPSSAITTVADMVETVGTYFITYWAINSVGLRSDGQCRGTSNTYVRTVVIQDTLKPVIQIKYKGNEVAKGGFADKGTNGEDNSAYQDGKDAGHFMAEETATSTVNGWVIGAVASAVTGLALLGFSQRKATAPVSVPV